MKPFRTAIASLVLFAAPVAALGGHAVSAEPNNGPAGKPGQGCAVEDANGKVSYVPVGTQVGLFHCGSDGEWHFGTVTTDLVSQPTGPKGPKVPGAAAASRAAHTVTRR
ncbi:MAG: hypothetical protein R2726_04895 [Acidimicrobiales bacterium]